MNRRSFLTALAAVLPGAVTLKALPPSKPDPFIDPLKLRTGQPKEPYLKYEFTITETAPHPSYRDRHMKAVMTGEWHFNENLELDTTWIFSMMSWEVDGKPDFYGQQVAVEFASGYDGVRVRIVSNMRQSKRISFYPMDMTALELLNYTKWNGVGYMITSNG